MHPNIQCRQAFGEFARALQRENARVLLAQIKVAKPKSALSKEARAHLAECENTLDEALKAPMMRPGV